jgi:hypothetical protein
MSSWHSYPSIYNFGHKAICDLLKHDVLVEEKVDGSQFSFGVFKTVGEDDPDITAPVMLRVRSKGAVMHPDAPEKMFTKAVESVKEREHLLTLGWTYRGEYLQKPKHNALAYDRVPSSASTRKSSSASSSRRRSRKYTATTGRKKTRQAKTS